MVDITLQHHSGYHSANAMLGMIHGITRLIELVPAGRPKSSRVSESPRQTKIHRAAPGGYLVTIYVVLLFLFFFLFQTSSHWTKIHSQSFTIVPLRFESKQLTLWWCWPPWHWPCQYRPMSPQAPGSRPQCTCCCPSIYWICNYLCDWGTDWQLELGSKNHWLLLKYFRKCWLRVGFAWALWI